MIDQNSLPNPNPLSKLKKKTVFIAYIVLFLKNCNSALSCARCESAKFMLLMLFQSIYAMLLQIHNCKISNIKVLTSIMSGDSVQIL